MHTEYRIALNKHTIFDVAVGGGVILLLLSFYSFVCLLIITSIQKSTSSEQ